MIVCETIDNFIIVSAQFVSIFHSVLDLWLPALHGPVRMFFNDHMDMYLRYASQENTEFLSGDKSSWIATVWNSIISVMLMFFLLSIIETFAQQELKRTRSELSTKVKAVYR